MLFQTHMAVSNGYGYVQSIRGVLQRLLHAICRSLASLACDMLTNAVVPCTCQLAMLQNENLTEGWACRQYMAVHAWIVAAHGRTYA